MYQRSRSVWHFAIFICWIYISTLQCEKKEKFPKIFKCSSECSEWAHSDDPNFYYTKINFVNLSWDLLNCWIHFVTNSIIFEKKIIHRGNVLCIISSSVTHTSKMKNYRSLAFGASYYA